jgi:hypothetical protein
LRPEAAGALSQLQTFNVRLQTRAACGASPCKPLFGGIGTKCTLQVSAVGQGRSIQPPLYANQFRTRNTCVRSASKLLDLPESDATQQDARHTRD